jgi:hypothetical protein
LRKGRWPLVAQAFIESATSVARRNDAIDKPLDETRTFPQSAIRSSAIRNQDLRFPQQEPFRLSTQRGPEMEAALVFIAFWSAPNGHGCRLQREHAEQSEGESKHGSLGYGERANRKTWMPRETHHLAVI